MNSLLNIMTSETEEVADNSAGLLSEATQRSRAMRQKLLDDGRISPVGAINWGAARVSSLCAVDGASAFKQMQSGDQIVVGATLADGQNSRIVKLDKQCAYSYMGVHIHTSNNTNIVNAMRAMTEIAVLGDSPHDISIIDGAMLNNYLSVLLALHQNYDMAQTVLNFLAKEPQSSAFYTGVEKIFRVSDHTRSHGKNLQRIVALAKSDSSSTMARTYFKSGHTDLKDKLVASIALNPGEVMTPLPLKATPLKPELLESNNANSLSEWDLLGFTNWNINKLEGEDKERLFKVFHMGRSFEQAQSDPDCSVFNQYAYLVGEGHLYFTYYKPSLFKPGEQALRVEFVLPWDSDDAMGEILSILPYLEADIAPGASKEPFSQYMVDRYAKDAVTRSMSLLESRLRSKMLERGEEALHSLSSYRT